MKHNDFQTCKSLCSAVEVGRNRDREGGRPSAFPTSQDSLVGFSHASQGRYTPFGTWGAIPLTFTKVHCGFTSFISTLRVRNWFNGNICWPMERISKVVFHTRAWLSRIYAAKLFLPNSVISICKIFYRFACNDYTKWLARGYLCYMVLIYLIYRGS